MILTDLLVNVFNELEATKNIAESLVSRVASFIFSVVISV